MSNKNFKVKHGLEVTSHITASGNISNVSTTHITASGNISGSSTSTGSFGQLVIGKGGAIALVEDQRIYFEADKRTWIESHVADSFRMVAGGNQMLLLDYGTGNRVVFGNSTKVFIGANNNQQPSNELEVDGIISASGDIATESDLNLKSAQDIIFDKGGSTEGRITYSSGKIFKFQSGSSDPGIGNIYFNLSSANPKVGIGLKGNGVIHLPNMKELTLEGSISMSGEYYANADTHSFIGTVSASKFIGNGSQLTNITPSPAGSDTQVQFNDGGSSLAGDAGLTYNKTTNGLSVGAITSSGGARLKRVDFYNSTDPSGSTYRLVKGTAGTDREKLFLHWHDEHPASSAAISNVLVVSHSYIGIGEDNPDKHLVVMGDISSSGRIYGDDLILTDKIGVDGAGISSGKSLTVAGDISASGIMYVDEVESTTNSTNTLLFNDDQSLASNMVSLQSINFINLMVDGNDNGTGGLNIMSGSYDTDTAKTMVRVNSGTGNVGIGTTTPTEKLVVAGNISASGDISSSGGSILLDSNKHIKFKSTSSIFHASTYLQYGSSTIKHNNYYNTAGGGHVFYTGSLTQTQPILYINSSDANYPGYVGIFNVSPTEKLDVGGNIKSDGLLVDGVISGSGDLFIGEHPNGNYISWSNGGTFEINIDDNLANEDVFKLSVDNKEVFTVDEDGDLYVQGNISMSGDIDLANITGIDILDSAGNSGNLINLNAGDAIDIGSLRNDSIFLSVNVPGTGGVNVLTVSGSGVGIGAGNSNPDGNTLDVAGNIKVT